jgi:uncharacterized protein DUF4340
MRGLRSTVALLVVLVGLSAYIYFVTWKQTDSGTEKPRERVFAALEGDKIDELRIKGESGDVTTLRKTGDMWEVTAPLAAKADASEITAITNNLGSLEQTRVVDEKPSDLKEYGLDMPAVEIEFKASGQPQYAEFHKLLLGGKSPTGGDVFARHDGDTRVVLIPGYVEAIFNRSTFNLRDKTLLVVDREKLDHLTATADTQTLELAKDATGWKLTKPLAATADSPAVESLITKLQTVAMKSIVAEQATPADLKKYGFDRPQATVVLTAGGSTSSLIVGGKSTEQEVYARDPSRPLVATIDSGILTDLKKAPDDYRRKEIFGFSRYSGTRLEFARDGQTVAFEKIKSTTDQPDKWRRVAPTEGEPDAMNMATLLTAVESLRATSFVNSTAKTGLDKPTLSVSTKFEDGTKEERVTFARTGADTYAASPGQPGAAVIPQMPYDDMIKALDVVSK